MVPARIRPHGLGHLPRGGLHPRRGWTAGPAGTRTRPRRSGRGHVPRHAPGAAGDAPEGGVGEHEPGPVHRPPRSSRSRAVRPVTRRARRRRPGERTGLAELGQPLPREDFAALSTPRRGVVRPDPVPARRVPHRLGRASGRMPRGTTSRVRDAQRGRWDLRRRYPAGRARSRAPFPWTRPRRPARKGSTCRPPGENRRARAGTSSASEPGHSRRGTRHHPCARRSAARTVPLWRPALPDPHADTHSC